MCGVDKNIKKDKVLFNPYEAADKKGKEARSRDLAFKDEEAKLVGKQLKEKYTLPKDLEKEVADKIDQPMIVHKLEADSDFREVLSKETGTQLDDEGTNFTYERSLGTYAVVTLTFYSTGVPTADISIPAGTLCRTTGTLFAAPVTFNTIADAVFPLAGVAAYYSYDRARYEFPVDALATSIGDLGNVGAGLISTVTHSVPQINGVTNLVASSAGSGVEDDDDFRKRIKLRSTGRDLNTVNGQRAFSTNHGFTDAFAIRVEDPISERADGVDVFVIDPYSTAITETFTYALSTRYYLANSPVKSVTAVVTALPPGPVSSADYDVFIDNTSPLRRSVDAADYIEIRVSAGLSPGDVFTVTYTYSQNIANFQNTINQNANDVLTSNVLVKRAFPLGFYINASLTLVANADGPATRSAVKNALIQFLDNYRLGAGIQESDIIIVMQQGYGDYPVSSVDAVVINSYYLMDELGTVYSPVASAIAVANTQYVVYGNAVLT